MPYTQDHRQMAITTPLGKDALLLQSFSLDEGLSRLFRGDLDLLAPVDKPVDVEALVGAEAALTVRQGAVSRPFHGMLSRVTEVGSDDAFITYRAEFVPKAWVLGLGENCRIFQRKSVPDILQSVLAGVDLKVNIAGAPTLDYCVQYRESDLDFASRLMEEFGIFYYFDHTTDGHTMVLTNAADHPPGTLLTKARYYRSPNPGQPERNVITSWTRERQVILTKHTLNDYNFEMPSTRLQATATSIYRSPQGVDVLEAYDYPGRHAARAAGEALAKVRMEADEVGHTTARGGSTCPGLVPGYAFDLVDHSKRMDGGYAVVRVEHEAIEADYRSEAAADGFRYTNRFACIPRGTPFRAARTTPKPVVRGVQTAKVVGPAGEEIFTDKYGRVKVQFHWDREGKDDEHSSCWIRVSHPWAGKGWGSMAIPRIGQEVIVDFLEGDPDRPIITGRVYNAEQMPAVGLPAGQSMSGLRSNTVKGTGYNEMAMDDTAGKERIVIHGQYDLNSTVNHDVTGSVGNDETLTVGQNRSREVGANESVTVGQSRQVQVGINESITIGASQEVTVGGIQAITVGAVQDVNVGVSQSISVGKNRSVDVGANDALKVAKSLQIDAGDEITLKAGQATLTLKKDGTVKISGKDIAVSGSGQIVQKASKNIVLKGQKILQN